MKITELIMQLKKIQKAHKDIDVKISSHDNLTGLIDINSIFIENLKPLNWNHKKQIWEYQNSDEYVVIGE